MKSRFTHGVKQNRIPPISFVGVSIPALQRLQVTLKADVLSCLDEAGLLVCGVWVEIFHLVESGGGMDSLLLGYASISHEG